MIFLWEKYKEGLALEGKTKDLIKNIWGNKSNQYINVLLKLVPYHHQVGNDKKVLLMHLISHYYPSICA